MLNVVAKLRIVMDVWRSTFWPLVFPDPTGICNATLPYFARQKAGQSHAHYSTTGLKRSDLIIDSRVHQLDMIPHDITMFRTFTKIAIHHLLKDRAVHYNFLFVSRAVRFKMIISAEICYCLNLIDTHTTKWTVIENALFRRGDWLNEK